MSNKYLAFYGKAQIEVEADSSYEAQQKATIVFAKRHPRNRIKTYQVSVILAEKDGESVVHDTGIL